MITSEAADFARRPESLVQPGCRVVFGQSANRGPQRIVRHVHCHCPAVEFTES